MCKCCVSTHANSPSNKLDPLLFCVPQAANMGKTAAILFDVMQVEKM